MAKSPTTHHSLHADQSLGAAETLSSHRALQHKSLCVLLGKFCSMILMASLLVTLVAQFYVQTVAMVQMAGTEPAKVQGFCSELLCAVFYWTLLLCVVVMYFLARESVWFFQALVGVCKQE